MDEELWAWVDLETTGLDKKNVDICEVAVVLTNPDLCKVDSFHRIINMTGGEYWEQPARDMHKVSGLWDDMCKVKTGEDTDQYFYLEKDLRSFLYSHQVHGEDGKPMPYKMAGSSVHYDRSILENRLGQEWVDGWFHHMMLDVSSVRMNLRAVLGPRVFDKFKTGNRAKSNHRAMDDILRSIDLLAYCRGLGPVREKAPWEDGFINSDLD